MKSRLFADHSLAILLLMSMLCGSVLVSTASASGIHAAGSRSAPQTVRGPHVVALPGADSPLLQALGARMPVVTLDAQAWAADDQTIKDTLSTASALVIDASTLTPDALKQTHWFQLAHASDTPLIVLHADAAHMTAITGLGAGGDLVVLRPRRHGEEVDVQTLLPSASGDKQARAATPDASALAHHVVALLSGPVVAQDTSPIPDPPNLPRRAVRIWDIVPQSPREYLPNPYQFPIPGFQTFLDDVHFKVGLYSVGGPENKKYVAISTYGGAGVSAAIDGTSIKSDTDTDRGYYLEQYSVTMGPSDQNQTALQIEKRAPEAENAQGSYTSSTGFNIGAGTDALSAGYNQSTLSTVSIPDFAVQYFASTTQAHWNYKLAMAGGQPYNDAADLIITQAGIPTGHLRGLPGLATGQVLNPYNQAVWSITGNYQGVIPFTLSHQATFRRINLADSTFQTSTFMGPLQSARFPVDFSLVNYAGDLSVAKDDISIASDPALPPGYVWLQALVHTDLADYDNVDVSFYNETSGQQQLIDTARINIATLATDGQRSGVALARVRWNVANLPGTQTVTVKIAPQAAELNNENNTFTREINLVAPRVVLSQTMFDMAEGGPTAAYQVSLSTRPTADVSVLFKTDGQTTVSPQSLTFTRDNWNTPQAVTITAVDDNVVQGEHVATIKHLVTSGDPDYNGIYVAPITVNIADNDNASPNMVKVTEGGARASYQFVLNRAPTATVAVSITTDSKTTVTPSMLTFTPATWNIPQTVVVTAVDDNVAQGDHASTISHRASSSDPTYSGVQLASVTAQVRDNDGPSPVINVTTAADSMAGDGQCSLREAIEAANTNATVFDCVTSPATYHIINLSAPGPYDLTMRNTPTPNLDNDASLIVKSTIIINGNDQTIRNRYTAGGSRIFQIPEPGDLTLNNLTIRDGRAFNAGGLWVFKGATANLFHVIVTHNEATEAGNVNTSGGGVINQGTLNILDSTISDNFATGNNPLNQQGGGGIINQGDLNIANTTIAGNRTKMNGGGIDNDFGNLWLTNVTITNNTADSDNDGNGEGGGLAVGNGQVVIKNSIIAGNFDTPNNAGTNVTTPDITRKTDTGLTSFLGTISSAGNNIIGNLGTFHFDNNYVGDLYGDPNNTTTPNIGATKSATPVDAMLGSPAGAEAAYPLQPGSPAVDRVAPTDCTFVSGTSNPLFLPSVPIAEDQNGDPRPRGIRCDSGATELAQPGVGLTVTNIDVPNGRFGSVYAIVLNTQPTSDVTIDLASAGNVTVRPSRLVFTPANWNVPQLVNIVINATTAANTRAAADPDGVIHHAVSSADPAYNGKAIPDVHTTMLDVGGAAPTPSGQRGIYLPLIAR